MSQFAIRKVNPAIGLSRIDAVRTAALISATKEYIRGSREALRRSRKLLVETELKPRSSFTAATSN